MTSAAIYLRVSTEDQAEKYSLDAQAEACRERATDLGATEVLEFADPGVSGEILERPGLTALRDAVESGRVGLLVALDPDRLARHLGLQILLTEELERAGCRLDFVEFEWKNSAEGQLYYHMRGAFAQYEKAKIKRRTALGRVQKARRGLLPLRFQPYGYRFDADQDTLTVDDAEADVVRQIFRWLVEEGLGPGRIAGRLQALGVPAPGGGTAWYRSTVARMLRNPVYTGRFLANRYDTTGMGLNRHRSPDRRVRPRLRPEAEWVAIPVPALVDPATWSRAQDRLRTAHRLWAGGGRAEYLLSGLATCGHCGRPMHGSRSGRRYYTCRSVDGGVRMGCGHWAQAEAVERAVWSAVWAETYDPDRLRQAWHISRDDGGQERRAAERQRLLQALARKETARRAFLAAMAAGAVAPGEASAHLEAIGREVSILTNMLCDHHHHPGSPLEDPVPAQVVAGLEEKLTPSERREFLRQAVRQVTVGRGKVEVHLLAGRIAGGSAEPLLRSPDADQNHE